MHVPVLAQAVVNEIDDARRNGEAQAFTASALRKNEGVDPEHGAVHIDQRASAVAGIDGSIGLQVGERLGRDRAGERVRSTTPMVTEFCKTFGTADGEHELADAGTLRADERKRGQIGLVNFEQGEIGFFMLADQFEPRGCGACRLAPVRQSRPWAAAARRECVARPPPRGRWS
jgi:hypothetical protein